MLRKGACIAGGMHGRWGACVMGAYVAGVCMVHILLECILVQLSCNIYVPDGILARLNSGKRLCLHRLTEKKS